jgi:hypothetical protein
MGIAAEIIGIRWGVALGGVLCMVVWLWMLTKSKTAAAALEKEHIA